jgi:glycerol 3-phosphatase-2
VLYRGAEPVPGAAETVEKLRSLGKRVSFVTNNSSRTPEAIAAQLRSLGIEARPNEVETSALATAALLRRRGVASAFVVGGEGLRSALEDERVSIVEREGGRADAVVVGIDPSFGYADLVAASRLIQGGALLIASNADATYPAADGATLPGAGAIVAALETTSGTTAEVVGKPNALIFREALRRASGGRPLVVGDRLDSDIEGARRLGWDSVLVLTGISSREDVERTGIEPTYVVDRLDLLFTADRDGARTTLGMLGRRFRGRRFAAMTRVDDMRKALEATIGNLTPARAQELAKGFLEPGAAKEQIAKTAADMLEWSQRNRQRLRTAIQEEIRDQMRLMGVATQDELDAVRKRVRELERAAGMTASGRRRAASKKTTAKRASSKKPAASTGSGGTG